ncbi:ABC transporter permease [Ensifer adhaerens]|uniref:ABC transporter permease n=1 Tax=Ensifer adhaerens TaxID=106592 RepID=UPI001C4DE4CA|nr:ABC transporter permease [Ensifer adhaerens]MBW0367849.1 ABC transporter permease [Ensifer adhaerens]UCM24546.1 ABC transporter permease [Ensifer adhaerens]
MTQTLCLATSATRTSRLGAALRRAERPNRLRAFALALPALVFLIVTFAAPIGLFLTSAVRNSEVRAVLPQTVAALDGWDGRATPGEDVFTALVADLSRAKEDNTAAALGKRLNYESAGMRSRIMSVVRHLGKFSQEPLAPQFAALDPVWASPDLWAIIKRNASPVTPYYLLTSIDLGQDAAGSVRQVEESQAVFLDILGRTLWIAGLVTVATLALGFPTAYVISLAPSRTASFLLLLVLLPLWTSLLVRTTAWVVLLQTDGVVNQALLALGLTTEKLQLILTRFGTVTAMTHIQLPFTILPILSVMKAIPEGQMRAARSLGAPPLFAFWRVYAPQTLPGVAAGCLMTFILSLGYYITPALVGGPRDQMMSNFIATYINRDLNWGMAAALACLLLVMTLSIYLVFLRLVGADRIKLG